MAGSPKCWLGPGWVWLEQISPTWPPATWLLPAISSPVPATGSFTGSHPPATVAENWRMPAKLRLVASAPPALRQPPEPAHVQPVPSPFPACAPATLQRFASRIFLLGYKMIGLPIIWQLRTLAFCGVGACGFWRYRMPPPPFKLTIFPRQAYSTN